MWLNGRDLFYYQRCWRSLRTCDMLGFRLNVSPQKSTRVLRIQSDGLWHSINVRGLPLLSCSVKKEKEKKKKRYIHMSSILMHFHTQSASLSIYTKILSRKQSTWRCATVQTQFMVRPVHIIQSTSPFQSPAFTITQLFCGLHASRVRHWYAHCAIVCTLGWKTRSYCQKEWVRQ